MGDRRRLDSFLEPWSGAGDAQSRNGLNTNEVEAHVEITVYFSDREPAGPYKIIVPPRRTLHQRFNDLTDPEPIPKATNYASTIISDVPIVVQHTRLDSRQAENALLTTIAFSAD